MKSWVLLKFKKFEALWSFKNAVQPYQYEMNTNLCLLYCQCSAEEIKLALETFGAEIIIPLEEQTNEEL